MEAVAFYKAPELETEESLARDGLGCYTLCGPSEL